MQKFFVSAFTDHPDRGNPACVVITEKELPADEMQSFALEVNQPVTSFVVPAGNQYKIRWFYPEKEGILCGHGTVAASHILWTEGFVNSSRGIEFQYPSGKINAAREDDWIFVSLKCLPPKSIDGQYSMEEILGCKVNYVGLSELDCIVELESEEDLKTYTPDYEKLSAIESRAVILTCKSSEYDFVSRVFSHRGKNVEDAVTGSAHATLFPYWQNKLGKSEFTVYQCSARGGKLKLIQDGENVRVGGQVVTLESGV